MNDPDPSSSPSDDSHLSDLGRELLGSAPSPEPSRSQSRGKNWIAPAPEELQAMLPQYEVIKMLGRGGMGAVYMGRQIALERSVAIKILSADSDDLEFTERFKNEAKAMAKLNHPGIVAVYDFGQTQSGLLYIVMEYVDGTDIARMIASEGRLHTEHAMAITAHVCDALSYAHDQGIIHRDIKPANIMVGYDGVVKVADFGLAKADTADGQSVGLTQSGIVMGTMHYIAPEMMVLGSSVDQRADIYAVGVMLYQMLTGKVPHGMFALPSMQVQGLDPRYDGIIAKAMQEDRDVRYQNARELRVDLNAILTQPVAQVKANDGKAQPVLPTMARPQRPGAGARHGGVPIVPAKQASSSGWLWTTVTMVMGTALAAWFIFQPAPRDSPPPGSKASSPASATANIPEAPKSNVSSTQKKPASAAESTPTKQPAVSSGTAPKPGSSSAVQKDSSMPEAARMDPISSAPALASLSGFKTRLGGYQKVRAQQLGDLTAKYLQALAKESSSGDASQSTALTAATERAKQRASEIEKLAPQLEATPLAPLPPLSNDIPDSLKRLREIYDRETTRIETALAEDLSKSLTALEAELVKSGDLAMAHAVGTYRDEAMPLFEVETDEGALTEDLGWLVGRWHQTNGGQEQPIYLLDINSDGTATYQGGRLSTSGDWQVEQKTLVIEFENGTIYRVNSLPDNPTLDLHGVMDFIKGVGGKSLPFRLIKADEGPPSPSASTIPKQPPQTAEDSDWLTGRWHHTNDGNETPVNLLDLMKDGSALWQGERARLSGEWNVERGSLTIDWNNRSQFVVPLPEVGKSYDLSGQLINAQPPGGPRLTTPGPLRLRRVPPLIASSSPEDSDWLPGRWQLSSNDSPSDSSVLEFLPDQTAIRVKTEWQDIGQWSLTDRTLTIKWRTHTAQVIEITPRVGTNSFDGRCEENSGHRFSLVMAKIGEVLTDEVPTSKDLEGMSFDFAWKQTDDPTNSKFESDRSFASSGNFESRDHAYQTWKLEDGTVKVFNQKGRHSITYDTFYKINETWVMQGRFFAFKNITHIMRQIGPAD